MAFTTQRRVSKYYTEYRKVYLTGYPIHPVIQELLTTPEPFMAWLKSLPEQEYFVGYTNKAHDCPLYNFLKEHPTMQELLQTHGLSVGAVIVYAISFDHTSNYQFLLPEWAMAFIRRVDDFNRTPALQDEIPDLINKQVRPVIPTEAIAILEEVIRGS